MIKIIHQIWYQGEANLPQKYIKNQETWKNLYSDFEYKFWDASSLKKFIELNYPEILPQWLVLDRFIKKCDIAKYLLLFHFGGLYADMDTYPVKRIEYLLELVSPDDEYDIILSKESDDPLAWKSEISKVIVSERDLKFVIGNAVIISKKRVQFWLDFVKKAFSKKHLPILDSFSTWHLTRFIISKNENYNIKIIDSHYLLNTKKANSNTYIIHTYDGEWLDYSVEKPWEI